MSDYIKGTKEANVGEYLNNLTDDTLVIFSPTSMGHIDVSSHKGIFVSTHSTGKDSAKIDELCELWQAKQVVGFGGGTAIDIAKYTASRLNCRFICIPAMLTTNTFATNKAALMKDGNKVSLDARLADEIILDFDLIAKAEAKNLYGLCDVLSIHTALYDWRVAERAGKEKIDPESYKRSQSLLSKGIELATTTNAKNNLDKGTLFRIIGESGHITNLYGSGRPESGSEHIFAKVLESLIEIPHGISIAIGITLMSRFQENHSLQISDALLSLGVMNDIADKPELLRKVRQSLVDLRPRNDRYTILDERLPNAEDIDNLIDTLYVEAAGVTNEYSYH